MKKLFLMIFFLTLNLTLIAMYIENENDPNSINLAINKEDMQLLIYLLEKGINPNLHPIIPNKCSLHLPICYAALLGNIDAIKILLCFKASPNSLNDQECPLIQALRSKKFPNKYEICKLLLEAGANPNEIIYEFGIAQTPLTEAIHLINIQTNKEYFLYKTGIMLKIIKLLLQYGANPYLKLKKTNLENLAFNYEDAIEYSQNCKLNKIAEILKEYKDRRIKIVSLLLQHTTPKLNKNVIDLITHLDSSY